MNLSCFSKIRSGNTHLSPGLAAALAVWFVTSVPALAATNLTVQNRTYGSTETIVEQADNSLSTSGAVLALSGANLTLNAGQRVTLSPGFSIQQGATFRAAITGVPADSDGDGIPDYWETKFGLNPNNAGDASQDLDGDGLSNLAEYTSDKTPRLSDNGSSALATYDLRYEYNNRNQLTAIKRADGSTVTTYTYGTDGRRRFRWLANNTETDYNYDGAGRVNYLHNYRKSDGSWIQMEQYGYDLRDRRTWMERNGAGGDTYGYQADGQLTNYKKDVNTPRGTPTSWAKETSYAYDQVGNRTSVNDGGVVASYAINHANQYTSVTGVNIQHADGRGNTTQLRDWSYAYDAENRLIAASKPGVSVNLAYDPSGRLARRVVNGQAEYFTFDTVHPLWRFASGDLIKEGTIWGPRADEPLVAYASSVGWGYHYHSDALGSVIAVTNANRDVVEYYRYDPYGIVLVYDGNWNPRSNSSVVVSFLFTGQEWVSVLGLYNYKNRMYGAELGRFLQSDPAGLAAGDINLYRYVANGPLDWIDPDGLTKYSYHNGMLMIEAPWWRFWDRGFLSSGYDVYLVTPPAAEKILLQHKISDALVSASAQAYQESLATEGEGAQDTSSSQSQGDSSDEKSQTGSYTTIHESGNRYHGKGPKERSEASGQRIEGETGDKHIATDWKSAPNQREAFKDEARRIRADGGVDNPNNYNKRNSPGEKYLQEDGEP